MGYWLWLDVQSCILLYGCGLDVHVCTMCECLDDSHVPHCTCISHTLHHPHLTHSSSSSPHTPSIILTPHILHHPHLTHPPSSSPHTFFLLLTPHTLHHPHPTYPPPSSPHTPTIILTSHTLHHPLTHPSSSSPLHIPYSPCSETLELGTMHYVLQLMASYYESMLVEKKVVQDAKLWAQRSVSFNHSVWIECQHCVCATILTCPKVNWLRYIVHVSQPVNWSPPKQQLCMSCC